MHESSAADSALTSHSVLLQGRELRQCKICCKPHNLGLSSEEAPAQQRSAYTACSPFWQSGTWSSQVCWQPLAAAAAQAHDRLKYPTPITGVSCLQAFESKKGRRNRFKHAGLISLECNWDCFLLLL